MFTEENIAELLLRHHGVNPENAALAAGLILDEAQKTSRSLSDLIAASKSGYPMFYAKQPASETAAPTSPSSLTARVAEAARAGNPVPFDDVMAALDKMRRRGF